MDIPGIAPGPEIRANSAQPEPLELPDGPELLDRLAALGELLDVSYCATTYQLAQDEDLPDPWAGDLVSQRTLLRRLLRYAGEDDSSMPVALDDVRELAVEGLGDRFRGELRYDGRVDGRVHFTLYVLGDLRAMLGPSCVEVARAVLHQARIATQPTGYRAAGEDARADEPPDDLDAFLASFLLGFGVPVANACFDYRAEERVEGAYAHGSWQAVSLGFPPDLASWLLAVVYRAGGRDEAFVDRHRALLNPNQREAFDEHWDALAGEQERLRAALGWGAPEGWCEPGEPILDPLSRDELDAELDEAEAERAHALRLPNEGKPVFCVRSRRTVEFAITIGLLALIAGVVNEAGNAILVLMLGGGGLGALLGHNIRGSVCSEPECKARIPAGVHQCPGCGGTIAGEIARASDRLEARERLGLDAAPEDRVSDEARR
jgi:hypothetical protein